MVLENLVLVSNVENVEMRYTYSLTKSQLKDVQAYGIKVERCDYCNDKKIKAVEDEVKYISTHRHKVKGLLNMLYEKEVSPLHLIDIIGEQVDNWVSDFDSEEALVNVQ